jgi:hypothetical protein
VLSDKPITRRKSVQRPAKQKRAKTKQAARRVTPVRRQSLLVIDGDSFAHRSYHALPKTILGRGGKLAGAILGFANLLLRLYREEQPRAVLVAWDTLEVPRYRHEKLPAYQSGREFDDALLEQLDVLIGALKPAFPAVPTDSQEQAHNDDDNKGDRRVVHGQAPRVRRLARNTVHCMAVPTRLSQKEARLLGAGLLGDHSLSGHQRWLRGASGGTSRRYRQFWKRTSEGESSGRRPKPTTGEPERIWRTDRSLGAQRRCLPESAIKIAGPQIGVAGLHGPKCDQHSDGLAPLSPTLPRQVECLQVAQTRPTRWRALTSVTDPKTDEFSFGARAPGEARRPSRTRRLFPAGL